MDRNLAIVLAPAVIVLAVVGATRSAGQPTGSAPAAPAANDGRHGIAVLDLVRIFNECGQIKDLNEMIRRRTEEIDKEANQRRDVIQNKQQELSAFQPGKPDYETRRKDLTRLNVEANVWYKMQGDDVEREKFEWTRLIYEQAIAVAGEVAKEQGYGVVLQRVEFKPFEIEQTVQTLRRVIQDRTVIYSVPEIDISDQVIRRMDAAYSIGGGKKLIAPPDKSAQPAAPGENKGKE